MHILLIHQAFAALDEPGGTRHIEFANALVKQGFRFSIIASKNSYLTGEPVHNSTVVNLPLETSDGIKIIRLNAAKSMHANFRQRLSAYFGFMLQSFWAAVKIKEVDLVWGTSPPIFQAYAAMRLAKFKRVPFLFEVRDLWPDFAVELGVIKNKTIIALSKWLERKLIRQADAVIVNSPGFIDHVSSLGARRVELIPNGVDPDMFDPTADGIGFRKQNHLEQKFIIGYFGAHGISNNLELVLDSAHKLRSFKDIHFLLVGDGKEKQNLMARARKLNLSNVTFAPPIPKSQIQDTLASTDVCLAILKPIPLYKTTYPNKVFDYMAAGKPVICAIDGVIREVVEISGAGVFTPPGNPVKLSETILYLRSHPEVAEKMGIAGRKAVQQKYNREIMSQKLSDVINSLI